MYFFDMIGRNYDRDTIYNKLFHVKEEMLKVALL